MRKLLFISVYSCSVYVQCWTRCIFVLSSLSSSISFLECSRRSDTRWRHRRCLDWQESWLLLLPRVETRAARFSSLRVFWKSAVTSRSLDQSELVFRSRDLEFSRRFHHVNSMFLHKIQQIWAHYTWINTLHLHNTKHNNFEDKTSHISWYTSLLMIDDDDSSVAAVDST